MKGYGVNMLGTFQCKYNGQALDKKPTGKLQLLFVYLLLNIDTPVDRKEMAYLLWPESTDRQAQTNLRKLLHHLKKLLPATDGFLMLEDGQMMWKSDQGCVVDTTQFMEMAVGESLADLSKAESLYQGQLLPGVHTDWLIEFRNELSLQYAQVIQKLIAAYQRKRDYTQAIHYANKLLQYDPLAEHVHVMLMRLHLLNGNRSASIRQFEELNALMSEQLGIMPSKEAIDLYAQCTSPNFDPFSLSIDPTPSFIGRYQQWASLQRLWGQLKMGKSCFVLIEGERGMGKTYLMEQFSEWVAIQGATVRKAKCYPSKKATPYEAVIQWLEDIDLSQLAESYISELARIKPSLLKVFPGLPSPDMIDDPWKLRYFYEAIEEAFIASAKSLVLMIDDWQWIDEETRSFLAYMRRPERKIPLFIVVAMRTNVQENANLAQAFISDHECQTQFHRLRLEPLTETDTQQLIANHYLQHSEKDVRSILAVSGGNPLYIQELLLSDRDGQVESTDSTLRELMIERLSTLPSTYRKVIDGLTVLGATASLPLLMRIVSISEDMIQECVDFLCQLRFLKQTERGLINFYHDTIREAALSMISPAHKTWLHAQIAKAMESDEHQDIYSAAEIAYHYDQAGSPSLAAPYYEKAVARANELFDHDQAMAYSKRLLEIVPDEQSYKPLLSLAHAYRMKGMLEQAAACYRNLLQQYNGIVSIEEIAFVRAQLALCIRLQGNYHEALLLLQSAGRQLAWVDDQRGLVTVYRQMTIIHIHLGQFEQAHHYLELSRGEQASQQDESIYLGLKADILYEKAMYAEAMDVYMQQIQLANRIDTRIPLLNALFGMSLTYLETDQYAHAFDSILECVRLTRSVGDQIGLSLAIGILGKVYLRAGWVNEALPCLNYGLKQALQSSDERTKAILLGLLGHGLQRQGYTAQGLALLRQAEQLSKVLQFPLFHGNSLYYLGYAHCAKKEWTEAQRCLNEALQIMVRDDRSDLLCKVSLLLLQCEMAEGKVSVTEALAQLTTWLSQYPHHHDKAMIYFTLWNLSDVKSVREEAERFIKELYNKMPIPCYKEYIILMKLDQEIAMMKPPSLPNEVSSFVDASEIIQ